MPAPRRPAGLRGEQLRRLLPAGLAHLARRDRRSIAEGEGTRRSEHGREIGGYTVGVITCRPHQEGGRGLLPARDHRERRLSAIDRILAMKNITPETKAPGGVRAPAPALRQRHGRPADRRRSRPRREDSWPTQPGGPDRHRVSLVNYLDELPFFCDEVLPRWSARVAEKSVDDDQCARADHPILEPHGRAGDGELFPGVHAHVPGCA